MPSAKVISRPRVQEKDVSAPAKPLVSLLKSRAKNDSMDRKFDGEMRDLDQKMDRTILKEDKRIKTSRGRPHWAKKLTMKLAWADRSWLQKARVMAGLQENKNAR